MITKDLVTLVIKSEGVDKVTVDFDKVAKGVKEIELEAKDAKNAIRGLKEENKSLSESIKREKDQIKSLSREMKELAKSGDTTSKRYNALSEAQDNARLRSIKYQKQIQDNNETIKQSGYIEEHFIRTMNVKDMTMDQLSRRADYLKAKLNNIVKDKDLDKWNKYNNELTEVKKRQEEVAVGGEKVKSRFDSIANTIKKVIPLLVGYSALRIFQNLISGAIDWLKKAPEVAAKAEGISRAFAKLNNTSLLTSLRKETKGLISDLVLMQSTVKADRFGIPINNLGKYLKFAQQRAQETGQSVDYLTESIINGIGRKSPLILDNLGLSAARLKAEMKKGLDFTQATTKIVEEELKKQGDLSLTSADKATQASVKWDNAQLKIGNRLKWLSDKWNEFSGNVADNVGRLSGDSRSLTDQYKDQLKTVADLEVNTASLMPRYEELSKKTKLTKSEHSELKTIMQQVAATMPLAVTEWDKYGNAVAISTEKVKSFIQAEKIRLGLMFEDKIKEKRKDLVDYVSEFEVLQTKMDVLNSGKGFDFWAKTENVPSNLNYTGLYDLFYNLPKEKEVELRKRYSELKALVLQTNSEINYMTGATSEQELLMMEKTEKKRSEFRKMEKKQLKEWIDNKKNANSEYLELAQQIYNQRVGFEAPPKEEKESKILARQKEELKARLENQETAHKYELMEIKANAEKKGLAEDEYQKQVLDSDAKYYNARIGIYDQFVKDYNITNEKFKEDIKGGRADAKDKLVDISPQVDKNRLDEMKRYRDESLRYLEEWINKEKLALEKRNLSADQTAHELELIEISASETRLLINKEYAQYIENLEIQNGRTKTEAVREAGDAVATAETEVIAKRKALAQSMKETSYNVRSQAGLTTREEDLAHDRKMYKDLLANKTIDYETYLKLLAQLDKKYEADRIQEKARYNMDSLREQYNLEADFLRLQREQGEISEKEYQARIFRLRMEYAAKWIDKQKPWLERASNMFSALISAETAQLDAEYDVRIAAAEGNAKETERLEKEKAQKKLDIEKKYADVQFAIKASDIIANTAMAIMTGYAQLGPIAGSIAAAFLGITGAAQLIAANAEREKVKNMTLGGTSSGGSKGVIVAGKEEGGYINVTRSQDGKKFDAVYDPERRGFVDRPTVIVGESGREWVLSNGGIKNPTIAPVIGLIDEAQRNGTVESLDLNRALRSQRLAGYASGGSLNNRPVSTSPAPAAGAYRNTDMDMELLLLLRSLNEKGVIANIGITELEAEKKRKQDIDNKFTLKD